MNIVRLFTRIGIMCAITFPLGCSSGKTTGGHIQREAHNVAQDQVAATPTPPEQPESTSESSLVYSQDTDEYIRTPAAKRLALKAGQEQEITLSYGEPMRIVEGQIGSMPIVFQPNKDKTQWTALIDVPNYEDLGPEKFMRVTGMDFAGNPIVSMNSDRIPAKYMRRGPDGEFPEMPEDNFQKIPIVK